jgi:predicted ATPase
MAAAAVVLPLLEQQQSPAHPAAAAALAEHLRSQARPTQAAAAAARSAQLLAAVDRAAVATEGRHQR